MNNNQTHYMERAIALAEENVGFTSPNPSVGAVVVKNGCIVAEGAHRACGEDHAEVVAIERAGSAARGADLYVSLEPCSTQGRTPPCTEAIIRAGIARVVFAVEDPNPSHTGQTSAVLRQQGIAVESGLCSQKAHRVVAGFEKWIQKGLPYVTLKMACTLDGKIATRGGQSKWITGEASRTYVQQLRTKADAILVGQGTLGADDPLLTLRDVVQRAKKQHFLRVVLCKDLVLSPELRVFQDVGPVLIAVGDDTPEYEVRRFRGTVPDTVQVERFRVEGGYVDLQEVMVFLAKRNIVHLLVEGGREVFTSFLRDRLVDRIAWFVSPKILGDGMSVCADLRIDDLASAIVLKDVEYTPYGQDMLCEGGVCFPE